MLKRFSEAIGSSYNELAVQGRQVWVKKNSHNNLWLLPHPFLSNDNALDVQYNGNVNAVHNTLLVEARVA